MSVITLWSKVTVKAVWTPPLCQTNVSPRSWAWSAYHKGPVGLPVVTLHRARAYLSEPLELWAELQSLPRGPFHPGMCPCLQGDEKCPALLIKVYTISSLSLYQKDICGGIWPWWGIWVIWWWLWSFYLPSLSINSPGLQPLPPITWFQSSALDRRPKTSCQGGKIWPRPPGEEDSHWGERSIFFFFFCLSIMPMEFWSGLPFPSPVDHILSELFSMTHPSWVALHGMAHSFTELCKPLRHEAGIHACSTGSQRFRHDLATEQQQQPSSSMEALALVLSLCVTSVAVQPLSASVPLSVKWKLGLPWWFTW